MPAAGFAKSLDAFDLDSDDQSLEVAREEQIAATAKHEKRHRPQRRIGQQLRQLLRAADARKVCRASLDTESVVGRKADIGLDADWHRTIVGASA